MNMKFVKGMVVGTLLSAGIVMMYNDGMDKNKKKMMKKGKQLVRKLGMM